MGGPGHHSDGAQKRMRKPLTHLRLGFSKARIAENGLPNTLNLIYDHDRCLFTPDRETVEADGGVIPADLVGAALEQ